MKELIEEVLLKGSYGVDFGGEVGLELVEGLLFAGGDEDFFGVESVFEGIAGDLSFTFVGFGTGGVS